MIASSSTNVFAVDIPFNVRQYFPNLMTGRTPQRVGVYSAIPFFSPMHVPDTEVTVATLLRDSGYTTAMTGKFQSPKPIGEESISVIGMSGR